MIALGGRRGEDQACSPRQCSSDFPVHTTWGPHYHAGPGQDCGSAVLKCSQVISMRLRPLHPARTGPDHTLPLPRGTEQGPLGLCVLGAGCGLQGRYRGCFTGPHGHLGLEAGTHGTRSLLLACPLGRTPRQLFPSLQQGRQVSSGPVSAHVHEGMCFTCKRNL